ncbi:type IV secretion system protein [uncultured Helicobacter sp.]|uniref:type IV secretion system protein n=1 Tax=uncultured Helicobacter sp. TaxID=175537 RepID=UPI0037536311
MQENQENNVVDSNQESLIEIDKNFNHEESNEQKPKKPLAPYLDKVKDKLKNINVPHHIKLETMFDTVKDAHTIFAVEKKTYDFVINLNKMLIAIIAILIILIISLFPLKEKEPYLVGFSNATQNFVHIEKANETITTNDALLRNLIGSYIINRETINNIDDEERYEIVRTQSSTKVWKIFENIVAQESSIYGNSNLTRSVKVINIAKFKNGYANAEVSISLYALGTLQSQKRYRITLTYKFNTLNIDFESLPKNPTGFEVQEYAVTEIATIKELEEENKVNPADSKSKIKITDKNAPKTDSNEFLRDYQYKGQPSTPQEPAKQESKVKLTTPEEFEKLDPNEKRKVLANEIKQLRDEQKAQEKAKQAQNQQKEANTQQPQPQQEQPAAQTPAVNPFAD